MGGSVSKVEKEVRKEFKMKRSQSYNVNFLSQTAFDQDSDESLGVDWRTVGAKPGTTVWIADGKADDVRVWPKEGSGTFADGDTFLVLRTVKKGVHNLHLWVGSRSTDDEIEVGRRLQAYMDRHFQRAGASSVTLYDERQDVESALFRSYWKPPMAVLMGGFLGVSRPVKRRVKRSASKKKVASKKGAPPKDSKPRLFRVKGGANTAVIEFPPNPRSLNHGDAFVVNAGLRMFQFHGKDANERECLRAGHVARQMAEDYEEEYEGATVAINTVKGFEADSKEAEEFWALLGGKPKAISAATEDVDLVNTKVFRVAFGTDVADEVKFEKAAEAEHFDEYSPLTYSDVYVCDTGEVIYAWVGAGAGRHVRTHAIVIARQYLAQKGKNPAATCVRAMHGSEPAHFCRIFRSIPSASPPAGAADAAAGADAAADAKAGAAEQPAAGTAAAGDAAAPAKASA